MRSVSVRVSRGLALLVLVVLVSAVPAFADDPPPAFEPPQGHIRIPPGDASQGADPSFWDLFLVWFETRIQIAVG